MRHHDHRGPTLPYQIRQGSLHGLLGPLVQSRRGLVQQNDPGPPKKHPCDGQALPLSPGNTPSPLPDPGLVPVLHLQNEFVGVSPFGGVDDLVEGVVVRIESVGDVFLHRQSEELGVLRDDAEETAQLSDFEGIVGASVQQDRASFGVVKAQEEVDDGALAPSAPADQGKGLAGGNFQSEPVQDQVVRSHLVIEADVFQFQVSLHQALLNVFSFIGIDVGIGVPQGEDLFGPGGRPREGGHQVLQALIGIVHHIPEELIGDQVPHRHLSAIDQQPPEIENEHARAQVEVSGQGRGNPVAPGVAHSAVQRRAVGLRVIAQDHRLASEGFDRAYVGQGLRCHAVPLSPVGEHLSGQSPAPQGVLLPQGGDGSYGDEGEHGEAVGFEKAEEEAAEEDDAVAEEGGEGGLDGGHHHVQVVGEAGDEASGFGAVEVGHVLGEDFFEEGVADGEFEAA
mmetsp:Transcript_1181/g.2379  ORF Transcript_1181/g.2379 Transcript_1181/m.2379 type:complete len:452 (-) Transcript_1181:371-1726(-)